MNARTWRSLVLALLVSGTLSMGLAAPAEARVRPSKAEFARVAQRTASSLSSFLRSVSSWIASSTATICGDGSA